ncbi:tetratricopeptide repeat protein [Paraliomyxa miuraensis]|uniref:tetratricopeptide repeat protein n=1 Tax=Paraliomyxa miuraensis TaxID=376150 RepID=UPI00224FC563|nr:tetratricopeptide repeat protein [Paraliomyxa miuraensis]MCX4241822.1 tetratricopeptide repeat protein [Paraliomyxa miuraensis]
MAMEIGEAEFDAQVLERSHELPVLVDFWAQWCGPCRMLGPVLEQIAEGDERFVLVKIDTDQAPRISARYGIRSIPAVKLFINGKVAAEFVGALPGGSIRKFLDEHLPSPADDHAQAGRAKLAAGDVAAARTAFEAALGLDAAHAGANLALARLALDEGDAEAVERHAEAIRWDAPEHEQAEFLRKALIFHAELQTLDETTARTRLGSDDGDLDAWYALGCAHAAAHRWEDALQAFLESVMRKNKYRDAAAHKAMLIVFGLLGHDHELTDAYQRKLQIYT